MPNEKIRFDARWHTVPEQLVEEIPFTVRANLRRALVAYMAPMLPEQFSGDVQAAGILAQELAFLPSVGRGWGPLPQQIETTAKNLVDGYLAHRDAFAQEGFPQPAQAALAALRDYDFAL